MNALEERIVDLVEQIIDIEQGALEDPSLRRDMDERSAERLQDLLELVRHH